MVLVVAISEFLKGHWQTEQRAQFIHERVESKSDFEGDKECRIAVKVSVENWKADDRVNQSKSALRDEPAFSSGKPERSDGQRSITQDFFLKKEVPVGY